MKTKYIKVKTSERFPKEAGQYSTEIGDVLFSSSLSQFLNYDGDVMHIEWFLEEIPDREDEILEVLMGLVELKRIKDLDGKTPYYLEQQPKRWDKAKALIEKM